MCPFSGNFRVLGPKAEVGGKKTTTCFSGGLQDGRVPNWPFLKSLSSSSFVTVGSVWPVFLAGFLNFSSWLLELYETSQIPCQQGMEICHWKGPQKASL